VERLFFITKLDKAFIALNKEKVNLIRLVSSVVNDFKNFAEEKKINLILDYSDQSDFFIDADPEMMRQVFINLLDNAIKYSFEESEVVININRENNRNYFSIMNRSEPIPDELLPKLFDRFFRIESSRNRNFGGVGLGLSVVKQITDLHQFEIKIFNIPEGTFKVVIYF
jgi:signal transduction histidine kinase